MSVCVLVDVCESFLYNYACVYVCMTVRVCVCVYVCMYVYACVLS